jgi:hypothetical protein
MVSPSRGAGAGDADLVPTVRASGALAHATCSAGMASVGRAIACGGALRADLIVVSVE